MGSLIICPGCGSENEPGAAACRSCGSILPLADPARSTARKVVTVLFSDISGSTALGEELDPESLRRIMSRYFDETKVVLARHGGTVEKFIGDAVVAVFGVPVTHEDDALRAVRAAAELREKLAELNQEFQHSWGVTVAVRTGVNTGEVIAGDPGSGDAFVTGDAVNLAARLEQSATPGEILIGETTMRLVRDAVVAEDAGPLVLKGKRDPVPAWRVIEVNPARRAGHASSTHGSSGARPNRRCAGRSTSARSTRRSGELVTIMGAAGVGKSRLSAEFLAGMRDRATILTGQCPPYGEEITFRPIVSAVRDLCGIGERDAPAKARETLGRFLPPGPDEELVGDRLAGLLGLSSEAPGILETFWAVRKLLEHLGHQSPVVVLFDDIQWGAPTFLDLLEYLVDWIQSAPVLLICLARPELLEQRPGWLSGKTNATRIALEPLNGPETATLIGNLMGQAGHVESALTRVAELSEGNPLFVEQTLRMLVDDGLLGSRTMGGRCPATCRRSPSRRRSTRCSRLGSIASTGNVR